ncbi:uncharacterized protein PpBr36_10287 [Pyricularia pennisetigena]|nr:uncharacterized protein PpBr36_10287 [Pyricularia pennisetigena]TLS21334.1 hypothetical protein PpBr36_10287 [Pyricularia pennisetigena]
MVQQQQQPSQSGGDFKVTNTGSGIAKPAARTGVVPALEIGEGLPRVLKYPAKRNRDRYSQNGRQTLPGINEDPFGLARKADQKRLPLVWNYNRKSAPQYYVPPGPSEGWPKKGVGKSVRKIRGDRRATVSPQALEAY